MGQTERGSFTLTISCPLRSVEPQAGVTDHGAEPFARRTTRLLTESVARIWASIRSDSIFEALEALPGQPVISANLCEAILKMRPEHDDAALFFSASWAAAIPNGTDSVGPTAISFQADDFAEIENLYDQLKPETRPATEYFVGQVDQLKGGLSEENARQGEVVLSLFDTVTEEVLKTRANLDVEQYKLADELHMSGEMLVVHGRIQRGRRVSRLSEIRRFERFNPESTHLQSPTGN
jgi:hypothetical protein